jgi:hypothetical protein
MPHPVTDEPSVGEQRDAIRELLGERPLVCDHDDGHPEGILELSQEKKNLFAIEAIEISRRLVGKQNRRAIYESASERAALLLTAG